MNGRKITILRDTGAAQSLILSQSLPDNYVLNRQEFILLGGFPNTVSSYPLETFFLDSPDVSGTVKLAVVDSLPVPEIDMIIANDIAVGKPELYPILTLTSLDNENNQVIYNGDLIDASIGVITRSRARELNLDEVNLDLDILDGQMTDTMTSRDQGIMKILGNGDIDWHVDSFKAAQEAEFGNVTEEEVDNFDKPTFAKQGGLLYRFSRAVDAPAEMVEVRKQLVIPDKYRSQLMLLAHENNLSGHLGVSKTFKKVAESFYWPQMRQDVKRHVLSCKVCQLVGKPNQKVPKAPLIPIPSVGEPFTEVIIDVVGPLPRTRGGNEYLLTIIDRMSRYPEAIPLRRVKSEKIVEALVGFFTKFGIPKVLQSDCGTNFTSRYFKKKMEELGVKHITSSPYHPESQGQVERFHQTLKSVLKKFCLESGNDWDKEVPYALFSIRSMPGETLGFSPFQLIFGHCVRGPLDVVREHWEGDAPEINVLEYITNFQGKMHRAWEFARKNLLKSQNIMKTNYDIGTKKRTFNPGDKVLVLLPLPGNPLKASFSGPWKVLKKVNEVNYIIETPNRRRNTQLCHINMLKPFISRFLDSEPDPVTIVSIPDSCIDVEVKNSVSVEPTSLKSNSDILDNLKLKFQHLDAGKASSLISLIHEYKDLFKDSPGRTNVLQHDVDVGDARPIKQSPYRLNPQKREIVNQEVQYMLDHDLIEHSFSPWSSPVVLVKKEGGQHRLCFDYRKVNEVSKTDCFPLPRVEDCIDRVGSAKFISKFDLLKGYWQVGLTPKARGISAFVTGDGLFECKVMPFGMKNAAATFQRLMNFITRNLEGCVVYIDDLIIYSNDWETHLQRIRALFNVLLEAGLVINLSKSDFAQAKVIYLGHEIGLGRVAPKQANVQAISEFPSPSNRRGVRRFLGMVGYYRKFIKNFADIAHPLTNLLKKDVGFLWSEECQVAFEKLKAALVTYPLLRSPDFSLPFSLATDASDTGIGAVLLQAGENGNSHPVAYFSRKLSSAERRYSTIEKEALALVNSIKHFEIYLSSSFKPIMVYTDHNPLVFIQKCKNTNQRVLRWSLMLQEYDLDVRHVSGKSNVVPDVLSRV